MAEREEELVVDKLCSGDRPSVYVAGMVVAQGLKVSKTITLGVDVLGRVVVVPHQNVTLKSPIYLSDEFLNELDEDMAIELMVKEDRKEDDIMSYLSRRKGIGS